MSINSKAQQSVANTCNQSPILKIGYRPFEPMTKHGHQLQNPWNRLQILQQVANPCNLSKVPATSYKSMLPVENLCNQWQRSSMIYKWY